MSIARAIERRPETTAPATLTRAPARRGTTPLVVLAAVLLAVSVTVAVTIGPADLAPLAVWRSIAGHLAGLGGAHNGAPALGVLRGGIVWALRLPRVLTAAAVGAGLAVAGGVMQGLTRNPLAAPY